MWKWLRDIVVQLGPEGMSSDESEIEDKVRIVYNAKVLPWRRNIDKELNVIDAGRIENLTTFGRQGSKPVKRYRSNLQSTRKPVEGLPRAFYNGDWYGKCSKQEKDGLRVSRKHFPWMMIIGTGRSDSEEQL
jgi:hypothetical protein